MSTYGELGTPGYPYGIALHMYLEDANDPNQDPLMGGFIVKSGDYYSFSPWSRVTPQPTLAQLESTYTVDQCNAWAEKRKIAQSVIHRDAELGRVGTKIVGNLLSVILGRAPTAEEVDSFINT